jgi:hypothetical protein
MLVMFLKVNQTPVARQWQVAYTTETQRHEQTVNIASAYNAAEAVAKAYDSLKNNPSIGTITGVRAFRN